MFDVPRFCSHWWKIWTERRRRRKKEKIINPSTCDACDMVWRFDLLVGKTWLDICLFLFILSVFNTNISTIFFYYYSYISLNFYIYWIWLWFEVILYTSTTQSLTCNLVFFALLIWTIKMNSIPTHYSLLYFIYNQEARACQYILKLWSGFSDIIRVQGWVFEQVIK